MIIEGGIDISSLIKARNKFAEFSKHLTTEQEKAGAVQAFEYSYELAWKTLKRILNERGVNVNSPRAAFREAGLNRLIVSVEDWFIFLAMRNLSSHTYNEENLEKILSVFELYLKSLNELIDAIS